MTLGSASRGATSVSVCVALVLLLTVARPNGLTSQTAVEAEQAVLAFQRTYETARARREPVDDVLADDFVEIAGDGRVLTRSQTIEHYARFDDVSAASLIERQIGLHGDVAIIMGRTGEEGTGYSARRLYVWVREGGTWRLKVFQKTFTRPRTARLSPLAYDWPAEIQRERAVLVEEETFATRDPSLLLLLVADGSTLVDAYGEQFVGRAWLARSTELGELRGNPRNLRLLHQADTAVVVGDEVAPQTGIAMRFTRVWKRTTAGGQLLVGQWTPAAAEVFGADASRSSRPIRR